MMKTNTTSLKSRTIIISLFLIFASYIYADAYCTPPSFKDGPYTGISNVNLNSNPEFKNSSVYNDGYIYFTDVAVPALEKGKEYTITLEIRDLIKFAPLNARVWIDWNGDDDFDDPGEMAVSWNDIAGGTHAASFTVPSDAKDGVTRMRVYEDMAESGGHITPEPCGYLNNSSHPLGQHGNIEDYDIKIVDGFVSVEDTKENHSELMFMLYPNPAISNRNLNIKYNGNNHVNIDVYLLNSLGSIVQEIGNINLNPQASKFEFDVKGISSGQYYLILILENDIMSMPITIFK